MFLNVVIFGCVPVCQQEMVTVSSRYIVVIISVPRIFISITIKNLSVLFNFEEIDDKSYWGKSEYLNCILLCR